MTTKYPDKTDGPLLRVHHRDQPVADFEWPAGEDLDLNLDGLLDNAAVRSRDSPDPDPPVGLPEGPGFPAFMRCSASWRSHGSRAMPSSIFCATDSCRRCTLQSSWYSRNSASVAKGCRSTGHSMAKLAARLEAMMAVADRAANAAAQAIALAAKPTKVELTRDGGKTTARVVKAGRP